MHRTPRGGVVARDSLSTLQPPPPTTLSLSLCFERSPLLSPYARCILSVPVPPTSVHHQSFPLSPPPQRTPSSSSVRDTWWRGEERTYGTGRVGARWKTRTRVRKRKAERGEDSGGGVSEREREIERASLHAMGMGNGTPRNIGGH